MTTTILRVDVVLLTIGTLLTISIEDHTLCRLSPGLQLTGLCASSQHLGPDTPTDCSNFGTDIQGVGSRQNISGPAGGGNLPPWSHIHWTQVHQLSLRTGYVTLPQTDLTQPIFIDQDQPFGPQATTTYSDIFFTGAVTSTDFDCANSPGGVAFSYRRQSFCVLDRVFDLRSQLGQDSTFPKLTGQTGGGNLPLILDLRYFVLQRTSIGGGVGPPQRYLTGPTGSGNLPLICTILQRDFYLQIWIRVGSCHLLFSGLAGSGNLPLILVLQYFILRRTFIDGGVGSPQQFFTGPIDCNHISLTWTFPQHWIRNFYLQIWNRVGSWRLHLSGPTGGGNLPPFFCLQIQQRSEHFDHSQELDPTDRDLHLQQPAFYSDKTDFYTFWQHFAPAALYCHKTAGSTFWKSFLAFCGLGPWSLDQSSWTAEQELNRTYWTSFSLRLISDWILAIIQTIFHWWIVHAPVTHSCLFVIFGQTFWHLKQRHLSFTGTESTHSLSATFVPPSNNGTPGPKSRYKPHYFGSFSTRIFHCLCVFLLIYPFSQGFVRGEGCILDMEDAEASTTWQEAFIANCDAKPHVTRPEASRHASSWHAAPSKVVKRSFKRAYKRAVALGTTWYRGRCYAPADFPKSMQKFCYFGFLQTDLLDQSYADQVPPEQPRSS